MNRPLAVTLAASLSLFATAAAADGLYIGGNVGYTVVPSIDSTGTVGGTTEIELDNGYAVRGAIGYEFKPLRAELELGYGSNEVDTLSNPGVGGGATRAGTGDVNVMSAMLNGYFDIPISILWLRPYVGAGIGFAGVDFDGITGLGFAATNDDDTAFAYQFIGGIALELIKPIVFYGEYRYFGTASLEFRDSAGITQDVDGLAVHSFSLGARIHF